MEIVRLLALKYYDKRRRRFASYGFKNTGKQGSDSYGISVIGRECISTQSDGTCLHIRQYYQSFAVYPIIFWLLDDADIPYEHRLVKQTTETGDVCHYNIVGIDDKNAREYFGGFWDKPENFFYCKNGEVLKLNQDDLDVLLSELNSN